MTPEELFEAAKVIVEFDRVLATKYIKLAIKELQKKSLKIPNEWKSYYCKNCLNFFGSNTKTRISNHKVIKTCDKCGAIKRKILN